MALRGRYVLLQAADRYARALICPQINGVAVGRVPCCRCRFISCTSIYPYADRRRYFSVRGAYRAHRNKSDLRSHDRPNHVITIFAVCFCFTHPHRGVCCDLENLKLFYMPQQEAKI